MKSSKTIQKKFRIDNHTDRAFQKVLSDKKVTMQFVMESLLKKYIYKNLEAVIRNDK